jgi:hypothetical protein
MSIQSNINNAIHSIGTLSGLTKVITGQEKINKSLEDLQVEEYLKEDEAKALGMSQEDAANKLATTYSQSYKDVNEAFFGEPSNTPSAIGGTQSQQALMQMSAKDAWVRAKMGLENAQAAKAMKGGRHNQMRMRSGTKEEKTNE